MTSIFHLPNLGRIEILPQIALENNFSKKSRDRALAKAFLRARLDTDHTYNHKAVRWTLLRAAKHFAWLEYRAR